MQSFNFYLEAKDQYDLIIPSKSDGLILLSLFDKYGKENFSEDQIKYVIEKVYRDLGSSSHRNEYDRNNDIIVRLQEFFLWRNEGQKSYSIKAYGLEFCEKIRGRLVSRYSPAKIKRLLDSLYQELERHRDSADLTLEMWFEEHFALRNTEITAQIEILDQQVNESVRDFRKKFKEKDLDKMQLLDEIISNLDKIKEHAGQLKDAFKSTSNIDHALEDMIMDAEYLQDMLSINEVMDFNVDVRSQLEQISIRIDRIKPRIRDFIYEFNKKDFDRKIGLFIDFLITHTKQVREGNKKVLVLPEGVPDFNTYDTSCLPKFIIVPDRDISPKMPVELTYREVNKERQQELAELARQKLLQQQRVQFWFKHVFELLKESSVVDFTALFYRIMEAEDNRISIPIRLTSKIIRELGKHDTHQINIEQELIRHSSYPNLSLWKMTIQKK
jgi:uncharacterized protein YejL (UPF0352 family)